MPEEPTVIQLDTKSIDIEAWCRVLRGELVNNRHYLLQDRTIIPVSDKMRLWVGLYRKDTRTDDIKPSHIWICIEAPYEEDEYETLWMYESELPPVYTIKKPVDFTWKGKAYRLWLRPDLQRRGAHT
jgi:hypothetical protein